ncbi:P22 phage major capsid protein family protein [Rhodococcus rhodochrous]|uniref:P22 phage major capsid protein family protein n=1 Tax=Rhodococcus rhodochrous TaxID=1829 RepID=UPI00177AEE06|nr:P22 phage major capsid protein family protein [Rhodococcus rhodochrous]QOH59894.1 hypothetical protein C6Y44_27780 [Rhodococcus rhodochrous]
MPNAFLTPDVIARQALATLYETTVMLPLVYRDISNDFQADTVGDTINIRKPATFEGKVFNPATGIDIQTANEGSIPVVLDTIGDVSFEVTSKELTLDIADFDEQLLTPALEGLSQLIDRTILSLRNDVTQEAGLSTQTGFEWKRPESLIEAGRLLDIKNVPESQRRAVIGPTFKAHWLNSDVVKYADKSGSTEALRRGSVGNDLFGFDVYRTQNVGQPAATPAAGQPTTEVGVAFHPNAFCFASAALAVPPGANAQVVSYKGLSIRIAMDYDIKFKKAIVSLDTLFGVKTIDPNRAVLLKGDDAA